MMQDYVFPPLFPSEEAAEATALSHYSYGHDLLLNKDFEMAIESFKNGARCTELLQLNGKQYLCHARCLYGQACVKLAMAKEVANDEERHAVLAREAKDLLRNTLAIHDNLVGPDHANTADCLYKLAIAGQYLTEETLALNSARRAYEIYRKENNRPLLARAAWKWSRLLFSHAWFLETEQSTELKEEAHALRRELQGESFDKKEPDKDEVYESLVPSQLR